MDPKHHWFPQDEGLSNHYSDLFGQSFSHHKFTSEIPQAVHDRIHIDGRYNETLKAIIGKYEVEGRIPKAKLNAAKWDFLEHVLKTMKGSPGAFTGLESYWSDRATRNQFLDLVVDSHPNIPTRIRKLLRANGVNRLELVAAAMSRSGKANLVAIGGKLRGLAKSAPLILVGVALGWSAYSEAYANEGVWGVTKRVGKDVVMYDEAKAVFDGTAASALLEGLNEFSDSLSTGNMAKERVAIFGRFGVNSWIGLLEKYERSPKVRRAWELDYEANFPAWRIEEFAAKEAALELSEVFSGTD